MSRAAAGRSTTAERAVREIYEAHYGQLAGWTLRLVGDRDVAHDIATEAFVKLLAHFETVAEPRPWLYATVANLVKDHWRKRSREAAAYQRYEALALGPRDSEGATADRAVTLTVKEAVQHLPERLRTSVILYYYGDLSVGQIARQIGTSEGSVKRYLFEARAKLATILEGAR